MMGWRITGVKQLPETIVVLFMDSYIRHSTLMYWWTRFEWVVMNANV